MSRPSTSGSSTVRSDHAASQTALAEHAQVPSAVSLLFASLRPRQWTKNLFVFAGVLFGGHLLQAQSIVRSAAAFVIFCALSGVVYLLNDLADREADQRHPLKRLRPIASGQLSPRIALAAATVLGIGAMVASVALSPQLAGVAAAYVALLVTYSFLLKHLVI